MGEPIRVAVLGLYNSGSTGVAGMLHRLGVNLGPPFWKSTHDDHRENYYEAFDLAWHLRRWWDEPHAVERVAAADRVRFLAGWAALQECVRPGPVGAKHPLLSLCWRDLADAWGPGTRFVWSWRPLDQSIDGLRRRVWFPGYEGRLQARLWEALHDLNARQPGVIRLDWNAVLADPPRAARRLAEVVGLEPSACQLAAAAGFIRRGGGA